MKTQSNKNRHPEDVIYETKKFINELQKIQESYFEQLTDELNLNEEGKDFLFGYIYNESIHDYDGFDHYLNEYKKDYKKMLNNKTDFNSNDNGLNSVSVLDNKLNTNMDYMFTDSFNSLDQNSFEIPDDFYYDKGLFYTDFDEKMVFPDDNYSFKFKEKEFDNL